MSAGLSAKRGIFVAPFEKLVEPRTLVDLARRAEQSGWDGFFLWDHVNYSAPARAVGDAWIALAAIAGATERIRRGAFDLVVEIAPGDPVAPWEAAGATWVLTAFDSQPRLREVEAAVDAGP
jgi:hypothetical protein